MEIFSSPLFRYMGCVLNKCTPTQLFALCVCDPVYLTVIEPRFL